jgi:hypothetical protein
MNIFYLNSCPDKSARLMYNKHVVKMILESAQLLCTAHRELGNEDVPYKATHKNHPSAVWTRSDANHYQWVYLHMMALGREYTRRYGRKHLTIEKCEQVLADLPPNIAVNSFEQPPQCMPEEYKTDCSVQAYWNYYIGNKHSIATSTDKLLAV